MPTALPGPARRRSLTLRQTARCLLLLTGMRLLSVRMSRLRRHAARRPSAATDARLFATSGRWLALSGEIAALLGQPEPDPVGRLREAVGDSPASPQC